MRQLSPRKAETATGRQIQQFVVRDRRQPGTRGNRASKAGQKQRVGNWQAVNKRWKDSHAAKHNLVMRVCRYLRFI